jgi:hypothetical protein
MPIRISSVELNITDAIQLNLLITFCQGVTLTMYSTRPPTLIHKVLRHKPSSANRLVPGSTGEKGGRGEWR